MIFFKDGKHLQLEVFTTIRKRCVWKNGQIVCISNLENSNIFLARIIDVTRIYFGDIDPQLVCSEMDEEDYSKAVKMLSKIVKRRLFPNNQVFLITLRRMNDEL